jgi:hypothetical protein
VYGGCDWVFILKHDNEPAVKQQLGIQWIPPSSNDHPSASCKKKFSADNALASTEISTSRVTCATAQKRNRDIFYEAG